MYSLFEGRGIPILSKCIIEIESKLILFSTWYVELKNSVW